LLKRCIAGEIEADMVLQSVGDSGLHGVHGPAAVEWERVHGAPTPRAMEVSAGPAGVTDRELLERHPHRCFEGMLITAWAVGASRIRLLVRDGPSALRAMLAAELMKLRNRRPYPGMPEIVLRFDDAPPPADDGLPTLRQGIETLYWVPDILERGAAWFAAQGQGRRWAGA
jgi:formate dehydrogenase